MQSSFASAVDLFIQTLHVVLPTNIKHVKIIILSQLNPLWVDPSFAKKQTGANEAA